jgi:hypothetical protein
VLTNVGFQVPWLNSRRQLGWHYSARARGNQTLQKAETRALINVSQHDPQYLR